MNPTVDPPPPTPPPSAQMDWAGTSSHDKLEVQDEENDADDMIGVLGAPKKLQAPPQRTPFSLKMPKKNLHRIRGPFENSGKCHDLRSRPSL